MRIVACGTLRTGIYDAACVVAGDKGDRGTVRREDAWHHDG